jgi:SAM-dependent methyltransferase
MMKVNIGSGFNGLDDWINLDNSVIAKMSKVRGLVALSAKLGFLPEVYSSRKWPPIKIHDCRKSLPFGDGTVDVIYSSHFFEHVFRHETVKILGECYRVLKRDGIIRIVLPDAKKIASAYIQQDLKTIKTRDVKDRSAPFSHCDFFVMHFYPFEMNNTRPPGFIARFQEKFIERHKWMYDVKSFSHLMTKAGFRDICEKHCTDSAISDAQYLDMKPEISFFLEAKKL